MEDNCPMCQDLKEFKEKCVKVVLELLIFDNDKNDKLTATLELDNKTFSFKLKNFKGNRNGYRYRFELYKTKTNLLKQIQMITNRKPIVVLNFNESINYRKHIN